MVGKKILVALSGGADSTALFHLLRMLEFEVLACHVDHRSRATESDADASFCSGLCRDLGVPFELLRPEIRNRFGSREADWREMRYRALFEAAEKTGSAAVATGHHRDDVAEGVLLQLLRGGSLRSMAGIFPRDGKLIRPLLPFSRHQLRCWLAERNYHWVRDGSNDDPSHLRNLVRARILPSLETVSPRLKEHLINRAAEIAEIEAEQRSELERIDLDLHPARPEGIPVDTLRRIPLSLRSAWLHRLCQRWETGPCTRRQVMDFHVMLEGKTRAVNLSGGWLLRTWAGAVYLEYPASRGYDIPLRENSWISLPLEGWRVRLRRIDAQEDRSSRWCHPVGSPEGLRIRSPRTGDRLDDGRKLSAGIRKIRPPRLRWSWPILVNDDKILWIPGIDGPGVITAPCWIVEVERQ